ncbi:MAG: hypothetical protein ACKV2Q_16875 [Planctomycetaceae bacterium]
MTTETIPDLRAKLRAKDARIEQLETDLWLAELQIKAMRSGRKTGIPAVDGAIRKINQQGVPAFIPAAKAGELHGAARMAAAMKLPDGKPSIPAVIGQTFRKLRAPFATGLLLAASLLS